MDEFDELDRLVGKYKLHAAPMGGLKHMLSELGVSLKRSPTATVPRPPLRSTLTEVKRERLKRREVNSRFVGFDHQLMRAGVPDAKLGYTATYCKRIFNGKGLDACSMWDLSQRDQWLDEEWAPAVEAMVRKYRGNSAH